MLKYSVKKNAGLGERGRTLDVLKKERLNTGRNNWFKNTFLIGEKSDPFFTSFREHCSGRCTLKTVVRTIYGTTALNKALALIHFY